MPVDPRIGAETRCSMDKQPGEESRPQEQQERENETGEGQGLRGTLGTARQAVTRSFDRLTGAEFRRQFEEFTNVVTTTVLGIHSDQSELRGRLARLEERLGEEGLRPRKSLATWIALILLLLAGFLGAFAVIRTLLWNTLHCNLLLAPILRLVLVNLPSWPNNIQR